MSFIITRDVIEPENSQAGVIGPRNNTLTKDQLKQGQKFRMLDDDDIVYYYGFYVESGDSDEFEPLVCFGLPNAGCTAIQYKDNKGKWQDL